MEMTYDELVKNLEKAENLETLLFLRKYIISVSNHNTDIFVELHKIYMQKKKYICKKRKNK